MTRQNAFLLRNHPEFGEDGMIKGIFVWAIFFVFVIAGILFPPLLIVPALMLLAKLLKAV
jgi:hypothetical protein